MHFIDNLEKSNVAMRQQFTLLSSWHSYVKEMQENYKKKLNRLQLVNDEVIIMDDTLFYHF